MQVYWKYRILKSPENLGYNAVLSIYCSYIHNRSPLITCMCINRVRTLCRCHAMAKSRNVELYSLSPVRLLGVVPN
jgi:hypothetical protein